MAQKKPIKPLSLNDLGHVFNQTVEPSLQRIFSEEITPLKFEMNQRFDDLYKKFEALKQEYIFANQQLKRQDLGQEELKEGVSKLKSKVLSLQKEIQELEEKINLH
jgi:predicted nuclease with TOPRIM domain